MLTADHAAVRRKGNELSIRQLDARTVAEATQIATSYLEAARDHVGHRREELEAAWEAVEVGKHGRLAAGLRKLVEDGCTFDAGHAGAESEPSELRARLFRAATIARRAGRFDREAVVGALAAELAIATDALEAGLFSDLRGEHVLRVARAGDARAVIDAWELGQAQAILLRAVRVVCTIRRASPGAVRAFFTKLKFHRLLFVVERVPEEPSSVRVVIDGPVSMFESVTRYGLRLALVIPALRELESWTLEADVRWGKERASCVFRLSSSTARAARGESAEEDPALHVSDEVRALLDGIAAARTPWRAEIASTLLEHRGEGVVIPDLVLSREGAEPVYVEVLGFWSRDAVWRRVELARKGLGAQVLFCASARLRVSPEVLDETDDAALYVYKGKPSARALLDRVERLVYPPAPCTSSSPERPAG